LMVVVMVCVAVVTPPASAFEHRGPRLMTVLSVALFPLAVPGAVIFGVEEGVAKIFGSSESRDKMRDVALFCFKEKALNLDAVDFIPPFSEKQFKNKTERIGSALREHGWPFSNPTVVATTK
jgi:hypothetical protein